MTTRILLAALALFWAAPAMAYAPEFRVEILQLPSDPPGQRREAPGGGRVLTPAVLYTPASGANIRGPAIVMLDRGPDSHPLLPDQASRFAAERLAARGYTVLSLYSGLERGFSLNRFEDQVWSIKAGLDYLEHSGYEDLVLVGQGYGAIAAAHYLSTQPDQLIDNGGERRVKAVILVNPLTELRAYPRAGLMDQSYDAKVAEAEAQVSAGRGLIPRTMEPGAGSASAPAPWIFAGPYPTPAETFLDYWGPQAARRNAALLASIRLPAMVIASGRDPTVSAAGIASIGDVVSFPRDDGTFAGIEDRVTAAMATWLARHDLAPRPAVHVTILDVTTDGGRHLQGVFYAPASGVDRRRPAIMLISGRTADTIQSSTDWMGWRLAQRGYAVFAPGMRISGTAGFAASSMAEVAQDIGHWMDRAAGLGHSRIVLAGHSNGGVWLSNYLSLTHDRRAIGTIYFAPTRDSPTYAREHEPNGLFERNVATAREAVASGRGMDVVIGFMTAHAYLDNNGPDSRAYHTARVREFTLPGLALAGGQDALMTDAFLTEFRRAYRGPLELIRYPATGHGFREVKDQLSADVDAWIARTFPHR